MSSWRRSLVALLWLTATACVWVRVVDWYLRWTDSSFKRWALLASLPVSLVCALWLTKSPSAKHWRLPALILMIAVLVKGRDIVLSRGYRASPATRSDGATTSLWRPVTTTDLVTNYYEVHSDRLSVERLRVAELTDLHIAPMLPAAFFSHALDVVTAQSPDLIFLTGDFVSSTDNLGLLARTLVGRLHAPLGVFAVLGNHDYWAGAPQVREILVDSGITLVARCQRLPEAIGRVSVCGTEAPWGPDLAGPIDRHELSLVLSHTPDNVYRLAESGASAVFSGHTHGGQGRVPGFGALIVPSNYGSRFDEGHFRVGSTDLFVSAGIGADAPALRIYCRPEIVVVDFLKNKSGR